MGGIVVQLFDLLPLFAWYALEKENFHTEQHAGRQHAEPLRIHSAQSQSSGKRKTVLKNFPRKFQKGWRDLQGGGIPGSLPQL